MVAIGNDDRVSRLTKPPALRHLDGGVRLLAGFGGVFEHQRVETSVQDELTGDLQISARAHDLSVEEDDRRGKDHKRVSGTR